MDCLPMPKFGPLAGLHVALFGIEIAGPFAGQMFTEWGAEVTRIENVTWADIIRIQPNYSQLSRRNLYALPLNISKNKGREASLKLMETTGIFIEANKGPALARRGITDEALQQYNPELVTARLSGFGRCDTEEYTNLPAYNTTAQVLSGYLIQNGDVDQSMPVFPHITDYFSGPTTTTATLAALHRMHETGKDESVDIAVYGVTLRMDQYFMMDYFNGGEMYPRMVKDRDPYYAGCGLYKRANGYIMMELVGIAQTAECFKNVGLAHLFGTLEIPEGVQLIHRIECPYGPPVGKKLNAWLAAHTIARVKERSAELNIACAKAPIVPELESNPQYMARESTTQWQMMDGRTRRGPNIVSKFRNNPG